jgi:hypothetical protein
MNLVKVNYRLTIMVLSNLAFVTVTAWVSFYLYTELRYITTTLAWVLVLVQFLVARKLKDRNKEFRIDISYEEKPRTPAWWEKWTPERK